MPGKGQELKALINAPEVVITPGVYDGFSARLIERAGFRTATISGAGTSESRLGWADRGIMGLEENLANARRIGDCTDLLLQADADTGYGNALNVYFVVKAFEKAGMAAIMIEDQVWPKRCGHMAGKSVIPAEEMVQKIKAANLGLACLVADSINGLFYRNAVNFALPAMECAGVEALFDEGDSAEVDFASGLVRNLDRGASLPGRAIPPQLLRIVDAGGIFALLESEGLIAPKA